MPTSPVPTKTPLGQEELRRRTGGLGQRHRTILFLIDGRRTLSEVLSLSVQAGATTSHFEDLVRLGFVELPAEEAPLPPILVEPTAGLAEGEIRHLEVEVAQPLPAAPVDAPEPVTPAPVVAAPAVASPVAAVPVPMPVPAPQPPRADAPPPPAPQPPVLPPIAPAVVAPVDTGPPAIVLTHVAPAEPPPAPVRKPGAKPKPAPAPEPPPAVVRTGPPTLLRPQPPAPAGNDQPALERAREALLETIRFDPQPGGGRVAERVRQAQSIGELIEVVWVMEHALSHSQRTHRGLLALQRARELLGLGNTLVDEDSQPSRLDDDEW